jgi:hypothetical protein
MRLVARPLASWVYSLEMTTDMEGVRRRASAVALRRARAE